MSQLIYLDNAATTAVRPEVFEKMKPFFIENYSNPSAVYSFAGDTKEAVEKAREQIAAVLGAKAKEIYFTAGGSESDNWAIKGIAEALQERVSTLSLRRLNITQCCIPVSIWKSTAMK